MTSAFLFLQLMVAIELGAVEDPSVPSALYPANFTVPGHSMHGETFDEGPRHAASLLGTTGRVTFPITTNNPLVQQFFNQGVGQLHGFWYFEAERSFRQAAKLDPECAMTYFGMALANTNNESRAKGFIAEAVKRKQAASDRERRYIDALNNWYKAGSGDQEKVKARAREYVKALEEILYRYPDDLEAKAMLCLTLWQKRSDLGITSEFASDALMNDVLAINPFHPVHHFRVHLWDNDKATVALNSAERCGLSAPGIAHMWHMSGHTYSELHRYFDAAWHQEAATRTDHAYMMRDRILPDRIHNFAHNNEWLIKNLQYLGRVHDAIVLAKNMIDLPQHPKLNSMPGEKSAHFGRLRLYQIYNQFELWDQLIADSQTQTLAPTSDENEQIKYFRHLGRAYFRRGDSVKGSQQLSILENRLNRMRQDSDRAADLAVARARFEGRETKMVANRRKDAVQEWSERIKALERGVDELHGYLLLSEGKQEDALARLNKSNDTDDVILADVEFLAGKKTEALKRLRERVNRSKNQVRPLAALVEMLWRQDLKEEAKETFEKLREISGSIDLDPPPFARLATIAMELGFGADWRKQKPIARNAAELPDLSSLGPFTWQPASAPEWTLPNGNGEATSLAAFRGRPLVVVFYLGAGCLHCVDQLQAFASRQQRFSDEGISIIAITSETLESLKKSQERYRSSGEFPLPIVCDERLNIFRLYQAYDDFEETPLHATLIIDANGKCRWHDIGAEPFMNVNFLLNEAKRLLHPERMEMPEEPQLIDGTAPIDALSPLNVFSPVAPTPAKKVARPEVAKGE